MIGLEFEEPIKELRLRLLKEQHVFTGVSGTNVLRLLPPLCLGMAEAKEFLEMCIRDSFSSVYIITSTFISKTK